jgi:TolB protein
MAVLGNDGSLTVVDAAGHSVGLAPAGDASFTFPAWSPDGTRLAAIRLGTDNTILVYDARAAASGHPTEPVVIFRSSVDGPFYLSWTPDGRAVSFLADGPDGLALRIAPADGTAPLDGSGPGAKIQSGNPLYFDWIDGDRLFAHVGTGTFAFLGEIGVDGASPPPAFKSPGDFRAVAVSHDRAFVSYVRAGATGTADVVVARRDGSSERTMPVFGTAGVEFSPVDDTVASIGPIEPAQTAYAIPLGPLRLIDSASGKVRTLLDGSVVSFWWSPDGSTIAALRVQPVEGAAEASSPAASTPPASASPASSASPGASPTEPPTEVRLLFVDVASGDIASQQVVRPGQLYIDQFLTYFDQYALSHRVWAPDSSSILVPVVESDGTTRVAVMFRNGDPPRAIDGVIGFWSP